MEQDYKFNFKIRSLEKYDVFSFNLVIMSKEKKLIITQSLKNILFNSTKDHSANLFFLIYI